MGNAVACSSGKHILRVAEFVVQTNESLPISIKTINRSIHAVECIVIATLLILRLVIYHRTVHLYLSGREVALEILHIRRGIPKAPLCKRE